MTPPPNGRRNGLVGTVLDKVLAYADRPWRVIALVFSILILGCGYAVWEQRAQIATLVLDHTVSPILLTKPFDAIAKSLVRDTQADLVVLARVSIPANTITNIAGYYAADPAWGPPPDVRVIFGGDVTIAQVIEAVEGRVVCNDVPPADGHRIGIALGMKRYCWVGVPPIPDVLVGSVVISWKTAPPPDLEQGARAELRKQAMKLAVW